jgi:hypothetical protein
MTDDADGPVGSDGRPGSVGRDAADVPESEPLERDRGVVYLLPSAAVRPGNSTEQQGRTVPSGQLEHAADDQEDLDSDPADRDDWAWVEEWRSGQEPTPWATGLPLAAFSALIVGVAIWVLSAGLSDRPVVAVLVNLLVAGGLAPAIWLSRGLPVLRWIAAGCAGGVVVGWVSAIMMLPLPAA